MEVSRSLHQEIHERKHLSLQTLTTSFRAKMTSQALEEDSRIPSAASDWTKETLIHLNAEYRMNVCTEFTFPNLVISADLENGEPFFR